MTSPLFRQTCAGKRGQPERMPRMTTVLDQRAGKAAASDLTVARRKLAAWLRDRSQFSAGRLPRVCPICGYRGVFLDVGHPPRWDARCPSCGSRERHRLLWLWATQDGGNRLDGKRILHFAPVSRSAKSSP